jgi:hypothetical protein
MHLWKSDFLGIVSFRESGFFICGFCGNPQTAVSALCGFSLKKFGI